MASIPLTRFKRLDHRLDRWLTPDVRHIMGSMSASDPKTDLARNKTDLARKERLAAALRANLRRRKAQERGRKQPNSESEGETVGEPSPDAPEPGEPE
jgi:hypothetical protein